MWSAPMGRAEVCCLALCRTSRIQPGGGEGFLQPRHSAVRDTPRLVAPSEGNSARGPVSSLDTPGQGLVVQFDPTIPIGASAYPPIADYGFLSDCETVALVAPNGGVEWMCLPRVDSPSVFGAMLDRDAGTFRLGPAGISVPASRRYLPGTMVLETSWWTGSGWIIVRDVLLIGGWHHETERSRTHRRAPTDYDADHVLLRTVRCVNGEVEMVLDCTAGVRLRPQAGPLGIRRSPVTTRASPPARTAP